MKKLLVVLALAICGAVLVSGCATGTPTAVSPTDVATAIADGCLVVQPTLASTAALVPNPTLTIAAGVNGVFCTANEAVAAQAVAAAAAAKPVAASVPAASAPVPASQ